MTIGTLTLRITPTSSTPVVGGATGLVVSNKALTTLSNLQAFFARLSAGTPGTSSAVNTGLPCAVRCDVNPVFATGTYTISSGSGVLTATINGVAVTTASQSGTDTACAVALAAAINASTNALVAGMVTATSALGVVTVTAAVAGKLGNAITTTASGTGNTADQARLVSGTDGTAQATAVKASGTFTAATCSGDIVAIINGQSITVTSTGVDADDAAAMATAILASEKVGVRGVVTATSALGVVTVTALAAGTGDIAKTGNGITTTATGTNFTAAQAALTGGVNAVSTRFTY